MRQSALALGIVSLVVFAGCGGGDSSSSSASSSSAPSAPPPPPPGGAPAAPAPGTGSPSPSAMASASGSYPMPTGGSDGSDYGSSSGGYPMSGADGYPMDSYQPPGSDDAGYNGGADMYPDGYTDPGSMPGYDGAGGADMYSGAEGYGYPGGPGMATAAPKSLWEQSIDAFRRGQHAEGYQRLLEHYAFDPAAAEKVAENVAWVPAQRRPGLGVRIGLVAHYVSGPKEYEGSPMPIGSKQAEAAVAAMAGGNRRGGGSDAGYGSGYEEGPMGSGYEMDNGYGQQQAGPEQALKDLEFHTGELGTKLLDLLKERIASGEYGAAYKQVAAEVDQKPENANQAYGGSDYYPDGSGAGPGYGAMMPGAPGGAAGQLGKEEEEESTAKPLALAVTWLGKVDNKEALSQVAKEAGVDVVVAYEIAISGARGVRFVRNSTKLRITSGPKDELLLVSAALENRTVLLARQKETKGEDPVDREIARAVEALDKVCKVSPVPAAVTAERVKQRVAAIVAEKPEDPLPAMVEVRFYAAKGLLPEEDYLAAGVGLMGEAKFAEMLKNVPSAGVAHAIGNAFTLPGMLSAVRGVNAVAQAAKKPEASKDAKQRGGLGGLLPFGVPGFGSGGGQPKGQQSAPQSGYPQSRPPVTP